MPRTSISLLLGHFSVLDTARLTYDSTKQGIFTSKYHTNMREEMNNRQGLTIQVGPSLVYQPSKQIRTA